LYSFFVSHRIKSLNAILLADCHPGSEAKGIRQVLADLVVPGR